ncbi:hypothetical protein JMG10_01665 [Nostoc ellipsosporum NOK]|jgi:hypothetical protein|nr:hypothetical protein [Nostoc ellipsosporum NOK]
MKVSFSNGLPLLLLVLACNSQEAGSNKDKSGDSTATITPAPPPANKISFRADTLEVETTAWNINLFGKNNETGIALNITSEQDNGHPSVNLNVNGIAPGTYPFTAGQGALQATGKAYGEYMTTGANGKQEHYFFQTGNITIQSIDTAKGILQAKFEGDAKSDKGKTIRITNGVVKEGLVKHGVTRF